MVWAHHKNGGLRDTPKWPGKLEHGEGDTEEDHDKLWKKECR